MRSVTLVLTLAFGTISSFIELSIGSGFRNRGDSAHRRKQQSCLHMSSAMTSMFASSSWVSAQKTALTVTTSDGDTWFGKFTRLSTPSLSPVDLDHADSLNTIDTHSAGSTSKSVVGASSQPQMPRRIVLHVIFLVHGHRGYSTDLAYLREQIDSVASEKLKTYQQSLVLIHSVKCNEGRTDDGIRNGGERVAQEMRDYIEQKICILKEEDNVHVSEVTLSLVGNSLGGLYSRYAISKLKDHLEQAAADYCTLSGINNQPSDDTFMFINGNKTKLHFNVFCTTASPHLGVADHTYIPMPRVAEVGIAYAMGETGRDLFRVNDLVKNMATSPYFLRPLSLFRKRIAYANAFSTDFVVPTGTAAFLHPQSDSLHRFGDHNDDSHSLFYRDNKMIIASLYTEKQLTSIFYSKNQADDELVAMSKCLDSLGWKKVFVDMRDEIPIGMPLPTFPIPKVTLRKTAFMRSLTVSSSSSELSWSDESVNTSQSDTKVAQSKELTQMFCVSKYKISLPMGHNMIVAHTKPNNKFSNALNQRGQPVMDSLAQELVHEVLKWNVVDYV